MATPMSSAGWGRINPCDHEIHAPYYIGSLAIAAVNCTESCPMSTYPDNRQVCHPCPAVGCNTCAEQTGCKDCLIFHVPLSSGIADGECVFILGGIFVAAALLAASLCACNILRFCCLALLSPRNPALLREALSHRRRAKAHDHSLPGNPFYIYDDTNVRRHCVSGVGPMLYFRFVGFLAVLSFMLVLMLLVRHLLPMMVEGSDAVFMPQLIPLSQVDLIVELHALLMYLLSLIAVVRWAGSQDDVTRTDIQQEPHLRHYALMAEGFPKSARSAHEVKAFFESVLGFEVEGISIAFDHVEEVEFIQERISRVIEKSDAQLGVYPAELAALDTHVGESQDGYILDCLMCSGYAFIVFSREEDREFCMRRFAEINQQMRSGQPSYPGDSDSDNEEAQALLNNGLRSKGGASRAVLFRGRFQIRVGHAPEPCGIQWHNFMARKQAKLVRVVAMFLGSLLLVLVVGAVMFAPAVLYEMSYVDIPKPSRSQLRIALLEQAVVVVSVAVGNRLLVSALLRVTQLSAFVEKANEDCAFMVCAFFVTVLNSTAPLLVASIVAAPSTQVTRSLAVRWLFATLWTCMLVTELAGLLSQTFSYWSAFFWARQSKNVSVKEAEVAFTTTEFPFATRYVDLLHCLTLVLVMVSLDSSSLLTFCAQCLMLLYSIYVYFVDKYTFLRVHRHTHYTSAKLDSFVQYLFTFPIAALFTLVLQRLAAAMDWWAGVGACGCSILLFLASIWICQRCYEPRRDLTEIPYIDVASLFPYNYFNTNHVHVLRTLHFPSLIVPPIYPLVPGKEYLQGGQFADYDDSIRLRETLMLLTKTPLKSLVDGNPKDYR